MGTRFLGKGVGRGSLFQQSETQSSSQSDVEYSLYHIKMLLYWESVVFGYYSVMTIFTSGGQIGNSTF